MSIKVGINGFGRIGRNIMRAAMPHDDIDIVAVNDLTDAATLAHLLKYDSILGNLDADISASGDRISVDGDAFQVVDAIDASPIEHPPVVLITGEQIDDDDPRRHRVAAVLAKPFDLNQLEEAVDAFRRAG